MINIDKKDSRMAFIGISPHIYKLINFLKVIEQSGFFKSKLTNMASAKLI